MIGYGVSAVSLSHLPRDLFRTEISIAFPVRSLSLSVPLIARLISPSNCSNLAWMARTGRNRIEYGPDT